MMDFSFDEWFVIVSIALFAGTVWHVRAKRTREIARQKRKYDDRILREKRHALQMAHLRTEVLRTRLIVDAWLLRHPEATTRHPGAKIVLVAHMDALRAYYVAEGCIESLGPTETVKHYNNVYWRAVWQAYSLGNVRILPPCPYEVVDAHR